MLQRCLVIRVTLTRSEKNIEVFFCLYANTWVDPVQCNSSRSRLLGFFSTLPGILRGLQCIRRYHDTKNVFPHLVNCGKYTFTVLFYMSLSMYRLDRTQQLKAFFIFCASMNAIYCCKYLTSIPPRATADSHSRLGPRHGLE